MESHHEMLERSSKEEASEGEKVGYELWSSIWNQDEDNNAYAIALAKQLASKAIEVNSGKALQTILKVCTSIVDACEVASKCNTASGRN